MCNYLAMSGEYLQKKVEGLLMLKRILSFTILLFSLLISYKGEMVGKKCKSIWKPLKNKTVTNICIFLVSSKNF